MRSQWDQGYMPPPCIATLTKPCEAQQYTGVGPLPWLSYGNNPPHPGQIDFGLIVKNVWRWWWHRTPFGGIDGGYNMALLIRKDISTHLGYCHRGDSKATSKRFLNGDENQIFTAELYNRKCLSISRRQALLPDQRDRFLRLKNIWIWLLSLFEQKGCIILFDGS